MPTITGIASASYELCSAGCGSCASSREAQRGLHAPQSFYSGDGHFYKHQWQLGRFLGELREQGDAGARWLERQHPLGAGQCARSWMSLYQLSMAILALY